MSLRARPENSSSSRLLATILDGTHGCWGGEFLLQPSAIMNGLPTLEAQSPRRRTERELQPLKSTLAILVWNEIESIPKVLPFINRSWVDEIIVVDGGSTDGTIEWCEANGFRVMRQKRRGYGNGMLELIDIAEGDVIIEFMGDGNCKVETIPQLIAKINEGYDLVIGSRYASGARSFDDTPVTRFGNWTFTQIINFLFHANYADAMMGYRAYRKDVFRRLEMDSPGLCFPTQGSIQFARFGYRVAEIPSDEPARLGGVRKAKNVKTGLELCKMIGIEVFRHYIKKSSTRRKP
jgi:glycosyltransferase involved in cell wall biosynthesis